MLTARTQKEISTQKHSCGTRYLQIASPLSSFHLSLFFISCDNICHECGRLSSNSPSSCFDASSCQQCF